MEIRDTKIQKKNAEMKKTKGKKNEKNGTHRRNKPEETNSGGKKWEMQTCRRRRTATILSKHAGYR